MQLKSITTVVLILIVILLGGCTVAPVHPSVRAGVYATGGVYPYGGYGHHDGAIRTTACQPFEAGPLMDWAKGLDANQHHSRSADVRVRNDRAECSQSERAGSQMGGNQNGRRRN